MVDPLLSRYSVIMVREQIKKKPILSYANIKVDEAHERSLYTDMLFGVLKK
jgi:ATP-dependent RNA helicase DDX35